MKSAEEFNRLLKKYLEGDTSEEENRFLEEWHRDEAELPFPPMSPTEKRETERKMWRQIRFGAVGERSLLFYKWSGRGAAVACLLLTVWWFWPDRLPVEESRAVAGTEHFEIRNTTGSDQEVRLSDSTVVLLKPNSRITYDHRFNREKREIFLTGEAFFQVRRDETKPFVVHAGSLITEVLGTSFFIRNHPKQNTTEVSVASGKVSVYTETPGSKEKLNGMILTANQLIRYNRETQHLAAGIVEQPVPRLSEDAPLPSLDFNSVPLGNVLDALTKHYGIEFFIADPRIRDCGINADLTGLPMFTQLELLCKSIDATYEQRGTVVFISGDGC